MGQCNEACRDPKKWSKGGDVSYGGKKKRHKKGIRHGEGDDGMQRHGSMATSEQTSSFLEDNTSQRSAIQKSDFRILRKIG